MLGELITGRECFKSVLIEDTAKQSARGLVKTFILSILNRVDVIHVLCFDTSVDSFIKGIPSQLLTRIKCHDCFSDPLGWEGSTESLKLTDNIVTYITNKLEKSQNKIAVVIDSLSPLLLHRPVAYSCQVIHRLQTDALAPGVNCDAVLVTLHSDLHDETTLTQLRHVCTTTLHVQQARRSECTAMCEILHKRPTGKVIKIKESFIITKSFTLEDVQELSHIQQTVDTGTIKEADPTANLTFNLRLTDTEKAARSEVQLPYMIDQSKQKALLSNSGAAQSKIFYQPDEADDFDEEDPDDDLDI